MKKIYLLFAVIFISASAFAQDILMLHGGTALTNNDRQIYESLLAEEFGVDTMAISAYTDAELAGYDLVLMSETPGSSDADNYFKTTAYAQIPVVSLKSYAFQKTDVTWISGLFQPTSNVAGYASEDVETRTEFKILADHDVFIEVGTVDDVLSFCDGDTLGGGGHTQCFDFTQSENADIATSATPLALSTFALDAGEDLTTMLTAIEENSTCKRLVVFGMHSLFVLNDVGLNIIRNAVYWVAGEDNPHAASVNSVKASNFSVYPNPVSEVLYVRNSSTIKNVELIDITGKIVANVANDGFNTMQLNTSDLTSGMYIVRLNTIDGQVYTDKVVK